MNFGESFVIREREFVCGRCELVSVRFTVPDKRKIVLCGLMCPCLEISMHYSLKAATKHKKDTVLPKKSCLSMKIITTNISVMET